MSSSQSSPSNVYLPKQPSYTIAANGRRYLKGKLDEPYIDEHDTQKLNIQCTDLEFDPSSQKDPLFRYLSAKEMQDYAKKYAFPKFSSDTLCDNFHRAEYVFHQLRSCLHSPEEDTNTSRTLDQELPCVIRCPLPSRRLQRFKHMDTIWKIEYFVRYNDSDPHVMCLVESEAVLREDALFLNEVWCILYLGEHAFLEPKNEKCNIVPITVISGSGKYFRVVQGYADGQTSASGEVEGSIKLRKTRIVDMGDGEAVDEIQQNKYLTLMRWLTARPKAT
ncbi:hypothetical protein F4861DRAFT_502145 [Xylaria intraflava]|nr:hypothetical protein F4861DRAFT_502145 [Xylaria intraflava]